jgi:multidrug efflux system membrane fusion protein
LLETDTAELGALLQPGAPCAAIIQLDQVKLVGFVPETDVSKITVGAMAGARLTSGAQVQGRVTFLSRSADELTRTFRVEVTVENADLAISDGQTAEILVASDGRTAHLIAQSSLTLDDDGVLGVRTVAEDNIVKFMPVTLLRDTAEGVWVTDLPETVDIITLGQEFVVDGVRVAPTYTDAKG